jgi:hypothetical protein
MRVAVDPGRCGDHAPYCPAAPAAPDVSGLEPGGRFVALLHQPAQDPWDAVLRTDRVRRLQAIRVEG